MTLYWQYVQSLGSLYNVHFRINALLPVWCQISRFSGERCKTLKSESEYELNWFCMSKNSMQIHGKRNGAWQSYT